MSFNNKFKDKKVLVTGHTGFKGSWLSLWLKSLGADVCGIALDPKTEPSNFKAINLVEHIQDLRISILDYDKLEEAIFELLPDYIFHLAAQAIVKESYEDPLETWKTNLVGTLNLMEVLRKFEKKCNVILVTSDKCYKNKEWEWGYREIDELGGIDPYSASKAATEIAINSYINSYFADNNGPVSVCSVRAGNVIGGGDWSESRLLPDCIKSWSNNQTVILRNPNSTRPWQHVLEPLSGYLSLASQLNFDNELNGESFNFGPIDTEQRTVLNVVSEISQYWDKVKWEIEENNELYESQLLRLNCDKAYKFLKWQPVMNFEQTIKYTSEWYQKFYKESEDMNEFTLKQIKDFTTLAKNKGLNWVKC